MTTARDQLEPLSTRRPTAGLSDWVSAQEADLRFERLEQRMASLEQMMGALLGRQHVEPLPEPRAAPEPRATLKPAQPTDFAGPASPHNVVSTEDDTELAASLRDYVAKLVQRSKPPPAREAASPVALPRSNSEPAAVTSASAVNAPQLAQAARSSSSVQCELVETRATNAPQLQRERTAVEPARPSADRDGALTDRIPFAATGSAGRDAQSGGDWEWQPHAGDGSDAIRRHAALMPPRQSSEPEADLGALREVANQAATAAIRCYEKSEAARRTVGRLPLLVVGIICGLMLLYTAQASGQKMMFLGAGAAFLAAAMTAWQVLVIFRRWLAASKPV